MRRFPWFESKQVHKLKDAELVVNAGSNPVAVLSRTVPSGKCWFKSNTDNLSIFGNIAQPG